VQLAKSLDLPFLPLYAWTGLWTSAILFLSAMTSGSNLVRYLTRFTDEIFSTLISVIFVIEAFSDVTRTFSNQNSTFAKVGLLSMKEPVSERTHFLTGRSSSSLVHSSLSGSAYLGMRKFNFFHLDCAKECASKCLFHEETSHFNLKFCAVDRSHHCLFICPVGLYSSWSNSSTTALTDCAHNVRYN